MPRLLKTKVCPHCAAQLPTGAAPRVCPQCAGSLQQRYMAWGCLSSAPKVLLVGWMLHEVLQWLVQNLNQSS